MIKVYSKANCPQCDILKRRLDAAGISYEEIRVDLDNEVRQKMIAAGHRSVPVVYKDDEHVKNIDKLFE